MAGNNPYPTKQHLKMLRSNEHLTLADRNQIAAGYEWALAGLSPKEREELKAKIIEELKEREQEGIIHS